VVKVCVREIRQALGDEATKPQFIETVGVQGYRFIAPITATLPVLSPQFSVPRLASESRVPQLTPDGNWQLPTGLQPLTPDIWRLTTHFVGRESELARLQVWYKRVQQGKRHITFVSGEAGIGKTTLVERFLAQAQARGPVRIGRGHCIEQYEHGEAYLPVLQALQQLCRVPNGDQVVAILRRYAPLWLVQLSGVIEGDELEKLQRQVQTGGPQRMLREFAEAIEVLAAETPLVLFLEDLQWSDAVTLELLAYLAQRRERARLLVIGSYRPADMVLSGHPLRRMAEGLIGRRQAQGLTLELFTQAEVEAYLTQRLTGSPVVDVLGLVIHRRTQGNALFVMHFVDYLLQQGLLVEADDHWQLRAEPATIEDLIPDHVQLLMTKQIEGLSREGQQFLEMASVVGMTFTAREVAAVSKHPLEATDAVYDELANQGRFLEVQGLAEWPDGSITVRYHFRHALCRHTLYHRLGLAHRVRWHRQLGEHFAQVYGDHTQEIATELAFHFERGREYRRAILCWQQAGEHALRRSVYQKALEHGRAGIRLLTRLPATAERGQLELKLRQIVNIALSVLRGYTDDQLADNLDRAQQLSRELGEDATLVAVVISLARLQLFRANRLKLEELVRQEKEMVERLHDPWLLVQLHTQLVSSETLRGRHTRAEEHYQQILRHYDPQARRFSPTFLAGDPFAGVLGISGLNLSLSGWLDQGWSRLAQGLARAEEYEQYVLVANGLLLAVPVKSLRGEYEEAWQLAKKMDALTREYDFSQYVHLGIMLQGGMAVQCGALEEGIAALTGGLSQYRATRAQLFIPYFLSLLADGYRQQGKIAEALQAVNEALSLTATNFDVFWEAELYRLRGELTLAQSREQRLESGKERQKAKSKRQK